MQLAGHKEKFATEEMAMHARARVFILQVCLSAVATDVRSVEKPSAADVQLHHTAIARALNTATPFKEAVESYRRHHDDFPASNLDAGLQPPDVYKNPDVRQIAIQHDGVINIMLTASSGVDSGSILLTPNLPKNSDSFAVEWKCTSASYSDVSDATGGICEYTKLP
jgi:hypothetical protein